jgi:hypothetical protein
MLEQHNNNCKHLNWTPANCTMSYLIITSYLPFCHLQLWQILNSRFRENNYLLGLITWRNSWMENLEWTIWNLGLIRSVMKGIFSTVCMVWSDTYSGVSRTDRRTSDWNLWMLEAFADCYSLGRRRQGDCLVYSQLVVEG